MDVERTIEFLLEHGAAQQARLDALIERSEAQHAHSEAQHARFGAELAQSRADFDEREKEYAARHEREMAGIRSELRRGVRLAVEEARRERKRRKEEDARLAASHAELEQSFQRFLESMKLPRNGHDQS